MRKVIVNIEYDGPGFYAKSYELETEIYGFGVTAIDAIENYKTIFDIIKHSFEEDGYPIPEELINIELEFVENF